PRPLPDALPIYIGQRAAHADQRGVHAQLDAVVAAASDAQQLDAVTQAGRMLDVFRLELGNALNAGLVELHRNAECQRGQQGQLVRRIDPFDVEGGIGFRIAQTLGFGQYRVEGQAARLHLGEDEVGGAVDDASDPLDAVGGQTFTHRLDDGDAPGHGSLEGHHHAVLAGRVENLVAVHGQHGLVGGHHVLALTDGFHHPFEGRGFPTDQLDHDVDARIAGDLQAVGGDVHIGITQQLARFLDITHGHCGDFYAAPC